MKTKTAKIIIPAVVIVATILIVMFIKNNTPEAKRFGTPPKASISVAALELKPQN